MFVFSSGGQINILPNIRVNPQIQCIPAEKNVLCVESIFVDVV